MKKVSVGLIGIMLILISGCTSMKVMDKVPYKTLEPRNVEEKKYTLGLALAGGGTKAADFSMGVLQGLSETKVINQVNVISSVSGGGYAALWFYSRLLNPKNQKNQKLLSESIAPFYEDCFATRYFATRYKEKLGEQLEVAECPNKTTFYIEQDPPDPYRYQNYIRGYQDIFSSGTDSLGNPAFNMDGTDDKGRLTNDLGQLAIKTVGAAVVNFIPNIVFDWELPLSPSRAAYKKGILRTFGAEVEPFDKSESLSETRPEGDVEWVKNNLTFELLQEAYKDGRVPLWIINTTAGENRELLNFEASSPLSYTSYEITPFGAGSGQYDYCEYNGKCVSACGEQLSHEFDEHLPRVGKVTDAVIMSAAFFDEQQRIFSPRLNGIFKPIQSLSTLNWGYSLKNPRVSDANQVIHKILPWPFYYWHGFNGADSVNVRMSDGGQSENLGAYALIRRKVSDIIISDHSQDRSGQMSDICVLKNNLQQFKSEPLYLHVPGLKNLEEVCKGEEVRPGYKLGYNIFEWKNPILLGCVSKSKEESSCTDDAMVQNRLYIIKPVVPEPNLKLTELGNYLPRDIAQQRLDCNQIKNNSPYILNGGNSTTWLFEKRISCELVGFWSINAKKGSLGFNNDDEHAYFPQHSTVGLTLNSSNWIYGASKELARYYSRQLAWFFEGSQTVETIKVKYKNAIETQGQIENQMSPKLSKQGILGSSVAE